MCLDFKTSSSFSLQPEDYIEPTIEQNTGRDSNIDSNGYENQNDLILEDIEETGYDYAIEQDYWLNSTHHITFSSI